MSDFITFQIFLHFKYFYISYSVNFQILCHFKSSFFSGFMIYIYFFLYSLDYVTFHHDTLYYLEELEVLEKLENLEELFEDLTKLDESVISGNESRGRVDDVAKII